MKTPIKKALRNGIIVWAMLGLFSFIYGGLYNEMHVEGLGYSVGNVVGAFFGAAIIGLVLAFLPVFLLSWLIYYMNSSEKEG